MKQRRAELGNLSSRFFAYVQLRQKDTVRIGELAPVLGITRTQERDLLRRLSESGWIVRLTRGVYLVPPRIPPGGKYSPGVGLVLERLMKERDGRYQICGPTAFHFHGLDDQIPTVTYAYNNRISGSRTIGALELQLIKVADSRLGAVSSVRSQDGVEIVYSSKARTLMDGVYDWSRFNSLPRAYDWIQQMVGSDRALAGELADVTVRYSNQATIRRVGYLLDAVVLLPQLTKRLERKLSRSKALIPWIPGKPARGGINRKWGIIANV